MDTKECGIEVVARLEGAAAALDDGSVEAAARCRLLLLFAPMSEL